MTKRERPKATLRKPPPPPAALPEGADAWVQGGGRRTETVERPTGQPANRVGRRREGNRLVVERRDGRVTRPMTLYLPVDLAQRLAVYCAGEGLTMSEVAARFVAEGMDRLEKGER